MDTADRNERTEAKQPGVTWPIQRGDKAGPVIAVDKEGRVLRSFDKVRYTIPHAIRLDPEGSV
jgi:hypothetical protein